MMPLFHYGAMVFWSFAPQQTDMVFYHCPSYGRVVELDEKNICNHREGETHYSYDVEFKCDKVITKHICESALVRS